MGCSNSSTVSKCQLGADNCYHMVDYQSCNIGYSCSSGSCVQNIQAPILSNWYLDKQTNDFYCTISNADGDSLSWFYVYPRQGSSYVNYALSQVSGSSIQTGLVYKTNFDFLANGTYYYFLYAQDSRSHYVIYPSDEPQPSFTICHPNWQCSNWGSCSSGYQSRTCSDLNSCGVTTGKPAETQSCTPACQVFSVDWEVQEANDGDDVNFIIDNNGFCAGAAVQLFIYQNNNILLPTVFKSIVNSTIGNNSRAQPGWKAVYYDNLFGLPEYYFTAVVNGQTLTSRGKLLVHPAVLQPPKSIEQLIAENPLDLTDSCPDYGTQTMNYNCIQMRNASNQYALQGINGEKIGEYALVGATVIFIGSVGWCIGGNLIAWGGITACPDTVVSCAVVPYVPVLLSTASAACGVMAGDGALIISSWKSAASSFRTQSITAITEDIAAEIEATGGRIITKIPSESGAIIRYSKNGVISQEAIVFNEVEATNAVRYTYYDWIGDYIGGNELLEFSRTKVQLSGIPELASAEKASIANLFKTGFFQSIADDYLNIASYGEFETKQLLQKITFLSGEADSGAAYYEKEIALAVRYDTILEYTTGLLSQEEALGVTYRHELTHFVIDEYISQRGATLKVSEGVNLVEEFFTDYYMQTAPIDGTTRARHMAYIQGFIRSLKEKPGYGLQILIDEYIDGRTNDLRAVYNYVRLSGDSDLMAEIEALIEGQIDLQLFKQSAGEMWDEAYILFSELPQGGSFGIRLNNALVKYDIIEGSLIIPPPSPTPTPPPTSSSFNPPSSSSNTGPFGCQTSNNSNASNQLLNFVLLIIPLIYVLLRRKYVRP